jgi:hypothetical protein
MSPQPEDASASRMPLSAPDVAAARAEEAAALRDIETNLPSGETKAHIIESLTGKHVVNNQPTWSVVTSDNPVWQARFDRFYAARMHLGEEQRREASIAAARNWSAPVVLVLGNPPNGTVAVVMRRRLQAPENVIVLDPNATAETLTAAFAAFDRSRELTGDDYDDDQVIPVQTASVTAVDAKNRKKMNDLIAKLRKAPMQQAEGIGIVQGIATDSRTRATVEFSTQRRGARLHYAP